MGIDTTLSYPRKIGFLSSKSSSSFKGNFENNAFYERKSDYILIAPYKGQGVPLSLNPGVLAHEHFHALFGKLTDPDIDESDKSEIFLKDLKSVRSRKKDVNVEQSYKKIIQDCWDGIGYTAINEALADLWAYVYTGHSNSVSQSLVELSNERNLFELNKNRKSPIHISDDFCTVSKMVSRNVDDKISVRQLQIYLSKLEHQYGGEFAQAIFAVVKQNNFSREQLAEKIISLTKKISNHIQSNQKVSISFSTIKEMLQDVFQSKESFIEVMQPPLSSLTLCLQSDLVTP